MLGSGSVPQPRETFTLALGDMRVVFLLQLSVISSSVYSGDAVSRYGDVSRGAAFPCRCEGGSCHPENGTCLEGRQCKPTRPATYRWQGDGCRIGNVAVDKPAYQLGQWMDHVPGLAVDGDTSQAGIRCAHPALKPDPAWWYVDLEDVYEIHRVVVYNTNGDSFPRMRNFVIVVGNSTNMTENEICAENNGKVPRGGKADLPCEGPLYGRYAGFLSRRTDDDKGAVVICEFVAMGRSLVDCGRCTRRCDDYDGCSRCPNGTRLPDCVKECSGSHDYGENCESGCSGHCADPESVGRVCDAYNGTCLRGCNINPDLRNGDWWFGNRCDIIVSPFTTATLSNLSVNTTTSSVIVRWTEEAIIPTDITKYYGYFLNIISENATDWNKTIHVPLKPGGFQLVTIPELEPDTVYRLTISNYRRYVNGTVYGLDYDRYTSERPRSIGARTQLIPVGPPPFEPLPSANTALVGGSAAGAIVLLLLLAAGVVCFVRRRRSSSKRPATAKRPATTENHVLQELGTPERRRVPYENVVLKSNRYSERILGPNDPGVILPQDIYENYTADTAIPISRLENYMEQKTKETNWFKNEFESIPCEQLLPCVIGANLKYKSKNRFRNILPYDTTRVFLQTDDDPDGYINASFITGYPRKEQCYIATQGPTKDTVGDFWNMVWQLKLNRIVMLTKVFENTKQKCEHYWPESTKTPQDFGSIRVKLISQETFTDFSIRILLIENDEEQRTVRHLQFLQWPDKSVPEHGFPLLTFRRKVRSFDSVSRGPTVVHCSAGVGRTGTYIAVDYLLEEAEAEGKVDVVRLLTQMRLERMTLIQTLSQYLFVHQVVLEAQLHGNTAIPCAAFSQKIDSMMQDNGALEKQFKVMQNFRKGKENKKKDGLSPENISKNRTNDFIPEDGHRPFLRTIQDEGSDYINAVYVCGFKAKGTMIASQMPMTNTVSDTWALVYDYKCTAIVMLDSDVNANDKYWPDESQPTKQFGDVEVAFISSSPQNAFTCIEINTRSIKMRSENPIQTKLFILRSWSIGQSLPGKSDLVDLIEAVETWQHKFQEPATLVQCTDGATKCGLYCGSTYLIDKIKVDQEVDVFLAVRYISTRRPQFVRSLEQYRCLHEVAMEYMSRYDTYFNFQ